MFYVIRKVLPGTPCSYPEGKQMYSTGFETREKAQNLADCWNRHCSLAGITYCVEPWKEETEPPYPLFN